MTLAIAAGGFDWSETGSVTAVTEEQALALAQRNAAESEVLTGAGGESLSGIKRDEASGSLYFDYTDDEGLRHTVWYADGETLRRWIDAANGAGIYRTAIWKLDGFAEPTLDRLFG